MKQEKQLINFRAPISLKTRFDIVCSEQGITRSYALVHIMNKFVIDMTAELKRQGCEFQEVRETVRAREKIIGFKEFIQKPQDELDLPVGFYAGEYPEPF